MSDTFTAVRRTAEKTVEVGLPDFVLFAAEEWPRDNVRLFYVRVPYALTKRGVTGRRNYAHGKPTKFGRRICKQFKYVGGVNPIFDEAVPHMLRLSVLIPLAGEPLDKPWTERHGLYIPKDACVAVQVAIEQHNSFQARFVEYLRRLF